MTAPLSLSLYCSALNLTPMTRELTDKKMRDEVAQSELICKRLVDLPATAKREARTATLEVRAQRMAIKPPSARKHLPEVTLSVVWVREVNGPDDGTDLDWLLLSSLPIKSKDDVLRLIDLVTVHGELYHRTR